MLKKKRIECVKQLLYKKTVLHMLKRMLIISQVFKMIKLYSLIEENSYCDLESLRFCKTSHGKHGIFRFTYFLASIFANLL